jgi:hypothetical protein
MFPEGGHYACQKKAWMEEEMMTKWIDLVLVPWKNSKVPGVIPIIILDAYCVHMMGMIITEFNCSGSKWSVFLPAARICVSQWILELSRQPRQE